MINNKHFSIFSLAVLLALVVAAVRPFAALADGETPPPDAPTTEVVVSEESQPAADEAAVDVPAAEDLTVSEAQEQLPEDTVVVVLDENGEALPLASQEAAEVVATADPYFWDGTKIVGFSENGLCPSNVNVCTQSNTPIQTAVDEFAQNQNANGYIYIEDGTYNGDVDIDAGKYNFAKLYGLMGSEKVFINGNINLYGFSSGFDLLDFTLNGSLGAYDFSEQLSIYGVTVNSDQDSAIFLQSYSGDVYMENVEANAACEGCRGVLFGDGTGDVTVVDSNFSSEGSAAAKFDYTSGEVLIEGGSYEGTDQGLLFDAHQGNVTLRDVNAYGGGWGGAFMVNGDLVIDGGDFEGTQGAGAAMMTKGGDVTIMNATIHDSPAGIQFKVDGSVKVCDNTFSNNGTDIQGEYTGTFDDCSPVNPPVEPPVNPTASQPVDKEDKEYDGNEELLVVYKSFSEGGVPGNLPSTSSFVAGMNINFLNAATGESVDEASGMWVTLDIPASMRRQAIRVMFWNGSEWIEISSFISPDGKQITFLAHNAGSYTLVTP